jgi:hypothetical protein
MTGRLRSRNKIYYVHCIFIISGRGSKNRFGDEKLGIKESFLGMKECFSGMNTYRSLKNLQNDEKYAKKYGLLFFLKKQKFKSVK